MAKQLIVKGHTFANEGRTYDSWPTSLSDGVGPGQCSCGATSGEDLKSNAARKRWHREHKLQVIAEKAK